MRKCTNCLHCKTNMINEPECCLGREIGTTECSAFAPKNEYIEEYLQQDKREKVVPSILTWAGIGSIAFSLYFCCLGWLEGSWGNPYLWTLLVIGIVCLAVVGILPLALRFRRESLKQEVRNLKTKLDVIEENVGQENSGVTNVDVLRRLSNLEKIIYGRE